MIKRILLISLILGLTYSITAQNSLLYGKITDDTNNNLPGAQVVLKKNGKIEYGTTSDIDGKYTISKITNGEYELMAMYVGYKKTIVKQIKLINDTAIELNIALKPAAQSLQAVKVVAYKAPLIEKDAAASVTQSSKIFCVSNANDSYQWTPHNTESYDKINDNTFQKAKSNPLSTFSIDVDNASYSNMRRFINNSQMPVKDAIRIEEMINYFDYDYAQPKDEHPFAINLEAGNCPWDKKHKLIRIGLQGKELITENIPPNNLVFLIDVSGSMRSYNKLPLLKKSMNILLDKLRDEDKVSIVVYAGAAGLALEPTSGSNKLKIKKAIENLSAGGSTAGGKGIKLAYRVAKENFIKEGNNRIILATDGDFNVGVSDNGSLVRLIEEKRKSGVYLSILGYGMGNYKDDKMEQLSNAGNGNYAYIDNILEADKVFGKQIWGTLYTIAKDVKIQVEFNPAKVKAYRLIGYVNRIMDDKDFNDDKKDAGEIGAGHSVTAFYEIIPAKSDEEIISADELKYQKTKVIGSEDLCTVKFRYKKPDGDKSILIVKAVREEDIINKNPSEDFLFATSVIEFGMLLRDSKFKGNASYASVTKRAKKNKGKDEHGYRSEFINLVRKAELIE